MELLPCSCLLLLLLSSQFMYARSTPEEGRFPGSGAERRAPACGVKRLVQKLGLGAGKSPGEAPCRWLLKGAAAVETWRGRTLYFVDRE